MTVYRWFSGGRGSAPVRVGAVLFFAASLADGVLMPFSALWAVHVAAVPLFAVGLLLACYASGELVATPLVGGLSDRIGRRPVLLLSTLGVGVGFALLAWCRGALSAAIVLLLIGLFESVLHPTVMAVIADAVPPAELRRRFGLTQMAGSVGDVLGPLLGAGLAGWSLGAVFLAPAIVLLGAALVVAIFLPETRRASGETIEDDPAILPAILRDRRLGAILAPLAMLQIATSGVDALLPLAATRHGTLTPVGVGWLFAFTGLVGVVFQMPVLRACRDFSGSRMLAMAAALLLTGFGLLLGAPGLPGFVLAGTAFAFAGILVRPMVQAVVLEMAPVSGRATYAAALSVVSDLKDAAGPALATPLFAIAPELPWLAGLGLTALAASGLYVGLRRVETRP